MVNLERWQSTFNLMMDTEQDNCTEDSQTLIKALNAQKSAAEAAKKELKDRSMQLSRLERQVELIKGIDPDRYQEMLDRQQQIEEEDLLKNREWDTLKSNYDRKQKELASQAKNWQGKYQEMLVQKSIKDAFLAANGIIEVDDLMLAQFRNRVRVEDGKTILLDRIGLPETLDGRNKTLLEKMLELKCDGMGYLFQSEARSFSTGASLSTIGADGNKLIIYTQEQARTGKANLDWVRKGKAVIR
jgi:hypothetical protein